MLSFLDKIKNPSAGRGAIVLALVYAGVMLSLLAVSAVWYFKNF